jgi:hypothetical protein
MKVVLTVFGTLLVLMGTVWFLQGANILTAGTSPMIGDARWQYYGAGAAIAGIALIAFSRRRPGQGS